MVFLYTYTHPLFYALLVIMNTSTTIAGISIPNYVGTAAGARDMTPEEITALAEATGFFTVKSTHEQPSAGNALPRYAPLPYGSIQSMGLPNIGIVETLACIDSVAREGLVIKASIAGRSAEEKVRLMEAFQHSKADLIEINASCPNIAGKPIIAKDFDALDHLLGQLTGLGKKPVGVKLPYYEDSADQEHVAALLIKHNISFITCINGILGLVIDIETERPVIRPCNGQGAIGGTYIHYFALRAVRNFFELLRERDISIIGVGGITNGDTAFSFLLAGADAVEVGTTLEEDGPSCLKRIEGELTETLARKGYTSVSEAKGKLRHWSE